MVKRVDLFKLDLLELQELYSKNIEAGNYGDRKTNIEWQMNQMMIKMEMDQNIFCPHCGARQPNDDLQYPINYHTPDEAVEEDCAICEKRFFIKERVNRTYHEGRTEAEAEK